MDHLAINLNAMLERIQGSWRAKRVSDDIAYDLRTPLSRLRHRLEAAREGGADGEPVIEQSIATSTVRRHSQRRCALRDGPVPRAAFPTSPRRSCRASRKPTSSRKIAPAAQGRCRPDRRSTATADAMVAKKTRFALSGRGRHHRVGGTGSRRSGGARCRYRSGHTRDRAR